MKNRTKNNSQTFLSILPILAFLFLVGVLPELWMGGIGARDWIFLIIAGAMFSAGIYYNNRYFSSLEDVLHTFSNRYNGNVEQIKITEGNQAVYYVVKGNYYGRTFDINTEYLRGGKRGGNNQMMNISLKINSPVIASLKLKRKLWGKVDFNPSTIANVYDIQFTNKQHMPATDNLYDDQSVQLRDEFVNLVDQQKLGTRLSRLGKKYRDYFSRFRIYTDGENIRVDKCTLIRSIDDMEDLMRSFKDVAQIIESLSKKPHSNSIF